jgi:oxygen-independent coproporphyrinogen-3 oxidase
MSEHLMIWRDWRVTRVSVGVQSFDDAELKFLGRLHGARAAADAVAACRAAGFAVSLDLMFGLPGADLRVWTRTLRDAVLLRPSHISIYQLTAEPGTPFAMSNPALPDGYGQYRYAQWYLPKKKYFQYEIASFAKPGFESRHNLNYWADGDYIGLGPAAWGYENGARHRNAPMLADYARLTAQSGGASVFEERVEGERAARQAAVLALRVSRGIDWGTFSERYGVIFASAIRKDLEKFPDNLISSDEKKSSLTPKGMRLGNAIWSEIVG